VVAAAKTVMAASRGLFLGAAGMAAGFAGGIAGGLEIGATGAMADTTLRGLLFTALAAVLGLGVGMVVRHSSAALAGVLVWGLVVENLLTVFMPERATNFLPFVAGNNLLGIVATGAFAESADLALTRTQDALVFGTYAAVALTIGTVLLYRRDTN
jgi:ABC-2 type transport system permease protein